VVPFSLLVSEEVPFLLQVGEVVVVPFLSLLPSKKVRVVSLEGSSLVVFWYLSASEIWPDKRGGISRGEQFSSILISQCI
jgi:hypothetical protein